MLEKYSEKISQHKVLILLLAIVLFGAVLRIIWFNPTHDMNEAQIALNAMNIVNGVYDPNTVYYWGGRYTVLLPTAISFILFGFSKITMILYIFIISLLQIILIYFLAREFFDKKIGIFAAFLLSIFPLDVLNSSILRTDILISFYSSLGIFLYYLGYKHNKLYLCVVSGLFFGWLAFTKIFFIFGIFFLFLYEILLLKQYPTFLKRICFFILGFIVISTPFIVYQYEKTGNPFYNIYIEYSLNEITQFKEKSFESDWKPNITFERIFFNTLPYFENFLLFHTFDEEKAKLNIYFIIFVFAVISLRKNKEFFLLWSLPIIIILMFELLYQQRYLLTIEIPVIILSAAYLQQFKEKTTIGFWFLLSLIILISFYQLGTTTIFTSKIVYENTRIMHEEELVYLALKDLPEKDVYITNYGSIPFFNLYFGFSKNYSGPYGFKGSTNTSFYDLHFVRNLSEIHDSYVVLDFYFIRNDDDLFQYYTQNNGSLTWFSEGMNVPQNWHPYQLFKIDDKRLLLFYVK